MRMLRKPLVANLPNPKAHLFGFVSSLSNSPLFSLRTDVLYFRSRKIDSIRGLRLVMLLDPCTIPSDFLPS